MRPSRRRVLKALQALPLQALHLAYEASPSATALLPMAAPALLLRPSYPHPCLSVPCALTAAPPSPLSADRSGAAVLDLPAHLDRFVGRDDRREAGGQDELALGNHREEVALSLSPEDRALLFQCCSSTTSRMCAFTPTQALAAGRRRWRARVCSGSIGLRECLCLEEARPTWRRGSGGRGAAAIPPRSGVGAASGAVDGGDAG